jgi:predicted SnoaL-like aldol condensation-catalyzing enzyme
MTPTRSGNEDRDLQIVLNAFDTLFNKRDYAAAERYRSARYIKHCAHIPPGREGLFGMIKIMPETLRYQVRAVKLTVLRLLLNSPGPLVHT